MLGFYRHLFTCQHRQWSWVIPCPHLCPLVLKVCTEFMTHRKQNAVKLLCEHRMANTSLFNLYLIWGAWGRIQDKLKKSEAIETRSPNPKHKPLSCSNPSVTLKHGRSYSAHEHWLSLKPTPWLTAWHHTSHCVCAHMHVLGTEPRALSIPGKCSTAGWHS